MYINNITRDVSQRQNENVTYYKNFKVLDEILCPMSKTLVITQYFYCEIYGLNTRTGHTRHSLKQSENMDKYMTNLYLACKFLFP